MIKITFVSENKTDNPGCIAEHGLSVFIETDEMKILFDAGASDLLVQNAQVCGIDLAEADALVISHGHYDHTEGVPAFCSLNRTAPVYIHRKAFGDFYGMTDGVPDEKSCGIWWSQKTRELLAPRLRLTDGALWLTENAVISGTVPDVAGCEPPERFFEKQSDGTFLEDTMEHEQFLAIRNRDKGIFIFSGCSHKGVIPVLEYAKKLFPGERVAGLIAGMHLYSVTDAVRRSAVERILSESPDMVMPVHCTGIEAICMLKSALGERCIAAACGDSYVW